jgi:hypothetical protein
VDCFDGTVTKLVPVSKGLSDNFYLVGSGNITFPETGRFEFGVCSVGKSRVFVDGQLVVDNGYEVQQTLGDTFYGESCLRYSMGSSAHIGTCYRITGLGTREEVGVSRGSLFRIFRLIPFNRRHSKSKPDRHTLSGSNIQTPCPLRTPPTQQSSQVSPV